MSDGYEGYKDLPVGAAPVSLQAQVANLLARVERLEAQLQAAQDNHRAIGLPNNQTALRSSPALHGLLGHLNAQFETRAVNLNRDWMAKLKGHGFDQDRDPGDENDGEVVWPRIDMDLADPKYYGELAPIVKRMEEMKREVIERALRARESDLRRQFTEQRETADEPLTLATLRRVTDELQRNRIDPRNGYYLLPPLMPGHLPSGGLGPFPTSPEPEQDHDPGDEDDWPPEPEKDRDEVGIEERETEANRERNAEVDRLMDLAEKCAEDDLMRPEATEALQDIVKRHGPPDTGWVKNLFVGLD